MFNNVGFIGSGPVAHALAHHLVAAQIPVRFSNSSAVYHDSRVCGNAIYLRASRARKRQRALNTKQDTKDAEKP
jgi:3-hydroxyisobutyrate dehydrogenase-like beta-hydroxyacid dehydrogenase